MAIEINLSGIFKRPAKTASKVIDRQIIDDDWVHSRYIIPDNLIPEYNRENRYYSTADFKHTSTAIGGNIAVGGKMRFTRTCDITVPGRGGKAPESVYSKGVGYGMGRFYSEYIDDNAEIVYVEYGMAKFPGLLPFFTRAIDYVKSVIANTGRSTLAYTFGQAVGGLVMLAAFPHISIGVFAVKVISKAFLSSNAFDYYTVEPNMPLYWSIVQQLTNAWFVEKGLLNPEFMPEAEQARRIGLPLKYNQKEIDELRRYFPWLISKDSNLIDAYAIATRAQNIANQIAVAEYQAAINNPNLINDFKGYVKTADTIREHRSPGFGAMAAIDNAFMFSSYLKRMMGPDKLYGDKGDAKSKAVNDELAKGVGADMKDSKQEVSPQTNTEPPAKTKPTLAEVMNERNKSMYKMQPDGSYPDDRSAEELDYLTKLTEAFDSSFRDGGGLAAFYVDYSGSVTESFSNSTGEIGLTGLVKSIGGKARDIKFNLAGGELGAGVKNLLDYGTDVLMGALDSVSFGLSSVLASLMGGGFIHAPKKWEDSDISLPTITYTAQLRSSTPDIFSQYQNMMLYMFMILAGTLPLSTGPASYTSPLLCKLFNKGVQIIDHGIFTNVSINRAVGNLGYDKLKNFLAVDISWTVADLSTIMTADVNPSIFAEIFTPQLDDNSKLGRYIKTLASRDLVTDKYTVNKILMSLSKRMMAFDSLISPNRLGFLGGNALARMGANALLADRTIGLKQSNMNTRF